MDNLFGVGIPEPLRVVIAIAVVLALIVLCAWLVRRFGGRALSAGGGRGRQPRLAVIDAATVDTRRRLILVRRDDVEHLLMIGGPSDVVIESNVVRPTAAQRDTTARVEPPLRSATAEHSTIWPLQPQSEPATRTSPAPEPVAQFSATADQRVELRARRQDSIAELAQGLPEHAAALPEGAPRAVDPRAAEPAADQPGYATASNDPNLAVMAQHLEDALRRPLANGEQASDARQEPVFDIPQGTPPEPQQTKAVDPAPAHGPSRNFYESLEQEMASLLGRPPGKT